jgi:signal peptidase I
VKKLKEVSKELLNDGYNVRISTRGPSMFPLIRTGDKITISPEKKLSLGDIIVYKRDEQMVCHRLARVFEKDGIKYYQTRGDAFFSFDEPVTSDQILGRVTKIERENVLFMRRILLLIHPILMFCKMNAFVIAILIKLKASFHRQDLINP